MMNSMTPSRTDLQSEINHFSPAQQLTFDEWLKILALKDDSCPFSLGDNWEKGDSQEMSDEKSSGKFPD